MGFHKRGCVGLAKTQARVRPRAQCVLPQQLGFGLAEGLAAAVGLLIGVVLPVGIPVAIEVYIVGVGTVTPVSFMDEVLPGRIDYRNHADSHVLEQLLNSNAGTVFQAEMLREVKPRL
eukprot:686767-Amorphochlora_amoeboformis.AAC.2